MDALGRELGRDLSEPLAPLPPEALRELVSQIRQIKAREERELDEGIQEGLTMVPRLLRGPIKKILFGGKSS